MKPRWEQHYTNDLASGEPGMIIRKPGQVGGRVVVFIFESEDDDGIHWYAPGFDVPGDAAMSNKSEMGSVTTGGDVIVRVDRNDNQGPIEIVRNEPSDPVNVAAAVKTEQFIERLGTENLEQARRRAFEDALITYGLKEPD